MDSINFCESPALGLARQSKQRLKWLMIILGGWLVWVALIFVGLNVLVQIQKNKAAHLLVSLDEIKPSIAAYQDMKKMQQQQKKSECAARVLNSLINSPVKGVAISGLSLTDKWKIQGRAMNQQALAEFQLFISHMLIETSWENEGAEFSVSGGVAC